VQQFCVFQPSTLNPQPTTLNPKPLCCMFQPSILYARILRISVLNLASPSPGTTTYAPYYVCYVCYIRRRRGCNDNYVCSVLRMLRMLRSSQSCLPFALHSLPPFVHARYGDTETANPKPSTLFPIPEPLSTNGKRQQGMGWLNMAESMQQFSHTIASQVSAFAVWSRIGV
jgi:hypothetical protein